MANLLTYDLQTTLSQSLLNIGPKNMKHPDKNWTIGVNIGGKWYNQAAFPSKDQDGNVKEGELTVILTPSGAGKSTNNSFAKADDGGNNEYTF